MNAPAARINGGSGSCIRRPLHVKPSGQWKCGCGLMHGSHWRACPDTHLLGGVGPAYRRPDLR